ncbi:Hsp20/alpha crystallin family protein [Bacillus massiliigorillae]|uniref:Hsp20/alpha crystallin family protein n=1 Tax=Bacillus massiliigorillae TaxID=1243664 RepID=UPI0003A6B1FD|nr:Hsp20/alpha crystallin family protein [Bacillus massiliigorillae]
MMKQISRWNPKNQTVQNFKNEMNDVFQKFFDDSFFSLSDSVFNKDRVLTPAMNVEEKENTYLVEVEMPGVDADDVDVELDGNRLVIKGEKKQESETKDAEKNMHIVEHSYGSFFRSFVLPDNVDANHITAEAKNGMLHIELPKNQDSKPQRIDVKKSEKK